MGLPVGFSQDNNCVLAEAGIRNAEKKNFQTAFINIYQNRDSIFFGGGGGFSIYRCHG